jgi:capsular polysaccharide biosynthesis protein
VRTPARKLRIRHAKSFIGRTLTHAFPSVHRWMPFFDTVRCMDDVGRTQVFTEDQSVLTSKANRAFASTLPVGIPRRIERSVVLVELEGVTLLGPTGTIVDEKRGVVLKPRGHEVVTHNDFRLVPTRVVHKPDANYFNMMDLHRGYRHYYHFLLDRLPKLYYLLHRFDLGRAPITVLTNTDLPPFQRDIYGFLGRRFPNIQFEAVPPTERWRVRRLYDLHNVQPVSQALASAGFVGFMRSLIMEGYGLSEPTRRRRLYVSRADAKLRRISNESQLLPAFAKQGFEAVVPGALPLREQVAMFMGAEAIAGPHGAGLANLLFAPSNARVLEILPSSMLREQYFLLSISMGQAYRALIGGAAGFLQHFAVDPGQVERSLQELMHAPAPRQRVHA